MFLYKNKPLLKISFYLKNSVHDGRSVIFLNILKKLDAAYFFAIHRLVIKLIVPLSSFFYLRKPEVYFKHVSKLDVHVNFSLSFPPSIDGPIVEIVRSLHLPAAQKNYESTTPPAALSGTRDIRPNK